MAKDATILLVDDSEVMRQELKKILTEAGYKNVIAVGDGQEAINLFNSKKPDLVLLDVIMPFKGGVEVLEEIGQEAKVLMISAAGQDTVLQDAKNKGAAGHIIKPFDQEKVIASIAEALAK